LTKIRPGRTHCNGVSLMLSEEWSRADQVFSVDSCLTGCGGWMNGRYFLQIFFITDLLC
jgi:hypothetical protein